MPDLFDSLLKQDLGHLRIIAELWGLELDSSEADAARGELSVSLLEPDLLDEVIESLSPEADAAITALVNSGGRIPWPTFTRRYGDIRDAGAGKRDREKLYLQPTSATETLYYRGLLGRAFFDTQKGPQEFAYIPDDLLKLISQREAENAAAKAEASQDSATSPLGRAASPGERGHEISADDSILDDATTLLAALRLGIEPPETKVPTKVLRALLQAASLLRDSTPQPEPVKAFLEAPRTEALTLLHHAWMESESFNELWLMPGILCEGEWKNQPQETREFLVNLLDAIPEGKWWSLTAFLRDIKQKYADFQRPAGDYDSWFIKREADGQFLRGFSSWDQVDGALIKYFIANILHWLGQVDLGAAEGAREPTSFRVASSHITGKEDQRLHISSQGVLSIPRLAPRVVRYQVSRFCEWDEPKEEVYRYRISTGSLTRAKGQGLKIEHLLALLSKYSDAGVPPTLVKALKRWEMNGTEARVQTQVILKVSRPEVLEELRKSRAAKFLGEVLSPTTVVVKGGAVQKVMEALMELGIVGETQIEE